LRAGVLVTVPGKWVGTPGTDDRILETVDVRVFTFAGYNNQ